MPKLETTAGRLFLLASWDDHTLLKRRRHYTVDSLTLIVDVNLEILRTTWDADIVSAHLCPYVDDFLVLYSACGVNCWGGNYIQDEASKSKFFSCSFCEIILFFRLIVRGMITA